MTEWLDAHWPWIVGAVALIAIGVLIGAAASTLRRKL